MLTVGRHFTNSDKPNAHETFEYTKSLVQIKSGDTVIFEQLVMAPEAWSEQARKIVASKYFYKGDDPTYGRETSVFHLVERVVQTIRDWGLKDHYFDEVSGHRFADELRYILLDQRGAFNSPVWFNLGIPNRRQQVSACFIQSMDDSMESILDFITKESIIFKGGSGSGTNMSRLRADKEPLKSGGKASGPISFMRGADNLAGAIKSGGTTRRAAKMVILDADHPDIEAFVNCKMEEELKAHALIDAGYDGGFNVQGGAYDTVSFQNANHSVRVTDDFMTRVKFGNKKANSKSALFELTGRVDGKVMGYVDAEELLEKIAKATWVCGDPGMQFHDTINRMHTCPNHGPIRASNPCSEYMFLDDTACNLASINLLKFLKEDGSFDVESYVHTCEIFIIAMEIMVSNAEYPTAPIAENSDRFRTLGLGFCNLGSMLMAQGLAYDSDEGRAQAAAVSSILTGAGYRQSAEIARILGPFKGYKSNEKPMAQTLAQHAASTAALPKELLSEEMYNNAIHVWREAIQFGRESGYRNAQISVLAPTGTIAFMMDADTTGIEPAISLVSYKTLVGGGQMKLVNKNVERALRVLTEKGMVHEDIEAILRHVNENDTIEGWFSEDNESNVLSVFDCAFKPKDGTRSISPEGHLKMMGACQPFISGAISKTVNMPKDCTVEDIKETYIKAWELGIKAVAIYRDGSKRTQPLNTSDTLKLVGDAVVKTGEGADGINSIGLKLLEGKLTSPPIDLGPELSPQLQQIPVQRLQPGIEMIKQAIRSKLPNDRNSITHKFSIAGHEGYIMVGMYEDGQPGEVFIKMNKEGSTISGLMDSVAILISMCLQYWVPLRTLVDKFSHTRFEPSGWTQNVDIRNTTSVMDYVFRFLDKKFPQPSPGEGKPNIDIVAKGVDDVIDSLQGMSDELVELRSPILRGGVLDMHLRRPDMWVNQDKIWEGPVPGESPYPPGRWQDVKDTLRPDLDALRYGQWPSTQSDAPPCATCGEMMVRAGTCYKCNNCGNTTGCG